MKRIVVLASGHGSNLQTIIDACQAGCIAGKVVGVLTNRPNAYALTRAGLAGIDAVCIDHTLFENRLDFDQAMISQIKTWQPDLVVLAGFMRILTPQFIHSFANQIVNIHPSLLPYYKGINTHQRVLNTGDILHGCSVHAVTPELDSGAIMAQGAIQVLPHDTAESLQQRVHVIEHIIYTRVITWLCSNTMTIHNGQVLMNGRLVVNPIRYLF